VAWQWSAQRDRAARVLTFAFNAKQLAHGVRMSEKSKCCLTATEYLAGGFAFAIVALIAVSSAQIARPQAPVPVTPPHYATTAIELSEEVARLSLSQQDQPADGATEARNGQSSEPVSDNTATDKATLEPVVPVRATAPPSPSPPPPTDTVPLMPVTTWWPAEGRIENAAAIRQRVSDAKSLRRPSDVASSSPPPVQPPGPLLADAQQPQSFASVSDDPVTSKLAKSDRLKPLFSDDPAVSSNDPAASSKPAKRDRPKPLWGELRPPAAIPAPAATARQPAGRGLEDAAGGQQRVVEAGSPRRTADAARSSPRPDQRPGPRLADAEQPHPLAFASERAASTYIGDWADDTRRCGETPLVINSRAAMTASGECAFGFVARETANRWRVAAICTSDGQFWRANIALQVVGSNLTWSSERGTETYVRCKR